MRGGAALLSLLAAAPAGAQTVSAERYRDELRAVSAALVDGRLDEARQRAQALLDARVAHGEQELASDRTVLAPVLEAQAADAPVLARRVDAALAGLEGLEGTPGAPHAPDRALLERLDDDSGGRRRQHGGDVGTLLRPLSLSERVSAWLIAAGERLVEFARWLGDLLRSLWPRRSARASSVSAGGPALAVVAAALALLALLAWRVWRRGLGDDAALEASAATLTSDRDEDPLSRGASEWQRHAEALARRGRLREALRAWYHAVLVALFAHGILHHRKGRTNWEYVARLPPELVWRPGFLDITRSFDRLWYGRAPVEREAFQAYVGQAQRVLAHLSRGTER